MYTPPAFAEDDPTVIRAVIRDNPFALVLSAGPDGPLATHVPVLVEERGDGLALAGHMARANPHIAALRRDGRARIVFSGPDAYVSPGWYATGPAVPTWNYVAVHALGAVRLVEDPAELYEMVTRLAAEFEKGRDAPWRLEDQPEAFRDRQIKGIVGFRMSVERLEGKRKLSQNRPAEDRAAVMRALAGSERESDRAVAAAMGGGPAVS